MRNVGFIGLGSMGEAMARRLLASGYTLSVYNRTKERAASLAKAGARLSATPRDLAEHSDIVMLSLTDDAAIRAVMEGANGALAGLRRGMVVVDCSTVSVSITREMAARAAEAGAAWLDAPVLGNPRMSENGEQTFVVGGDEHAFEACLDLFQTLGTTITYMGGTGAGQAAKIVHTLACAVSLAAYSEAIVLGERLGLERAQILDVLQKGAVASRLLDMKAPKYLEGAYMPTNARLYNMCKDIGLIAAEGRAFGQELPVLDAVRQLYARAEKLGLEDEDTSSVIKVLE